MVNLKSLITTIFELFTFKSVTIYPRWMEISYSVIAWINLIIIVFALSH